MCLRWIVYLTNRFHVAVRLFSNRSQMTSKCGKNKKVAHEAIAECVTDGGWGCSTLMGGGAARQLYNFKTFLAQERTRDEAQAATG